MENTKTKQQPLLEEPIKTEEIEILANYRNLQGYRNSIFLNFLLGLVLLFTGGLFGLVFLWTVRPRFWFRRKCEHEEAEYFLIESNEGDYVSCAVEIDLGWSPHFYYQCTRYVFENGRYSPYNDYTKFSRHDIVNYHYGLSEKDLSEKNRSRWGPNIIKIPVTPLWRDFLEAYLDPVSVYNYYCCIIWFLHEYAIFATICLLLSIITSALVIRNNRNNTQRLLDMTLQSIDINVKRNNNWEVIPSTDLLPGDLLEIPSTGFKPPCDLVIVSGSALVDESFLTGESLPVLKTAPEDDKSFIYNPEKDKRNTIYSCTNVLSAIPQGKSDRILAMAVRTGSNTSKGQLVKAILYNKKVHYVYEKQAIILWAAMLVVGIVMFFVTLYVWDVYQYGVRNTQQIIYAFESLAVLVSPLLPLIFKLVVLNSTRILEANNINTMNPTSIPLCGKVKTMCFDKTGTLTKPDLDVIGTVPSSMFDRPSNPPIPIQSLKDDNLSLIAMATCHNLTSLENFNNNLTQGKKFSGEPLDIKMFEATGWNYNQSNSRVTSPDGTSLEIFKRFEFDLSLQRMSVLARPLNGELSIFTKGSPEMIQQCCKRKTVPENFHEIVTSFSQNGCYILGLATRTCPEIDVNNLHVVNRETLENDLTFIGLLLFRNELKPESKEVILRLQNGRIRPLMITGDNIFTAFYIAIQSGIVRDKSNCFIGDVEKDENKVVFRDLFNSDKVLKIEDLVQRESSVVPNIGVTSRAFKELRAQGYDQFLVENVKIFARFRPLQKEEIVRMIMSSGHVTGMCGDGANDCAALSSADFGVALSEAEASLTAPFTARSLSPLSVVDLVREGRACLGTSFALFKFTLFFNVTQATVMFLAYIFSGDLSQGEYIVLDFLYFLPVSLFMIKSESVDVLSGNPPTSKIFGPTTIFSYLGHQIIAWTALGVALYLLVNQSWYTPTPRGEEAVFNISECTTMWMIGLFIYPACAISWSFGSHWRKPIFYNIGLMVVLVIEVVTLAFVMSAPTAWSNWYRIMSIVYLDSDFKFILSIVGVVSFSIMILWEYFVIIGPVGNFLRKKTGRGRLPYQKIEKSEIPQYHKFN